MGLSENFPGERDFSLSIATLVIGALGVFALDNTQFSEAAQNAAELTTRGLLVTGAILFASGVRRTITET